MPDNAETLLAKKLGQAEPFCAIFFVFTEYVAFSLVVLNSSYTFASRYCVFFVAPLLNTEKHCFRIVSRGLRVILQSLHC